MLNLTPSGIKLTPTGVKINTNLVWTSHNTGGVEFNTGVFAVNWELKFSRENWAWKWFAFLNIGEISKPEKGLEMMGLQSKKKNIWKGVAQTCTTPNVSAPCPTICKSWGVVLLFAKFWILFVGYWQTKHFNGGCMHIFSWKHQSTWVD